MITIYNHPTKNETRALMKPKITNKIILLTSALVFSTTVFASEPRSDYLYPAATDIPAAWVCLIVFLLSYVLVMTEERSHLRKSKPVILAAGIIWAIIGWQAPKYNVPHEALEEALTHDLDEYGGLLLFLLTAMTYISSYCKQRVCSRSCAPGW